MDNVVTYINPGKELWTGLVKRPAFDYAALEQAVVPILEEVKTNGDNAVKKYAALFDKADLADFKVSAERSMLHPCW